MTEAFCKLVVWKHIFWNCTFSFCYHLGLPSCSNSLPVESLGILAYKLKASFQVGRNLSVFPQDVYTHSSLKLFNHETTSPCNSKNNIYCIVHVTVSPRFVGLLSPAVLNLKTVWFDTTLAFKYVKIVCFLFGNIFWWKVCSEIQCSCTWNV